MANFLRAIFSRFTSSGSSPHRVSDHSETRLDEPISLSEEVIERLGGSREYLEKLLRNANGGDAKALYELAMLHYDAGKYQDTYTWAIKAARQNHAEAQYVTGEMIEYEEAREYRDHPDIYGEARAWYHKSAELGCFKAQMALGGIYRDGQHVPQDYEKAHMWYRMAADHGDEAGQRAFDDLLRTGLPNIGRGIYYDIDAAEPFIEGAERGDPLAQFGLAKAYFDDKRVVNCNVERALKWAILAIRGGKNDEAAHDVLFGLKKVAGSETFRSAERMADRFTPQQ